VTRRYQIIQELSKEHTVAELCDLLSVARSGYYARSKRSESASAQLNVTLCGRIQELFEKNRKRYGSPRITFGLRQEGYACNHKRVERLMRQQGLRARTRRRYRPKTTDSQQPHPIAPNLLLERAAPVRPDEVWVTDITYLPTAEGWLYLAGVMDLYSRKVIGWTMQETLETCLPLRALNMALTQRGHPLNVLHHSDRGCQYASLQYRQELASNQITASMSRKANCYDNATMESFWSTLKTELPEKTDSLPKNSVQRMVFAYIEAYYNRERYHSSLQYKSPVDFENQSN
jgi:putative transposase